MSRLTRLAHPRISSADALLGKAAPEVTESDARFLKRVSGSDQEAAEEERRLAA
jgi:hypothetical protein